MMWGKRACRVREAADIGMLNDEASVFKVYGITVMQKNGMFSSLWEKFNVDPQIVIYFSKTERLDKCEYYCYDLYVRRCF